MVSTMPLPFGPKSGHGRPVVEERGQVLLGEGDDHIGDAVNLASRLCHMAEPLQVLAPASLVSSLMVNTVERPIGDRDVDGLAEGQLNSSPGWSRAKPTDFDGDGDTVTSCGPDGLPGTADDDCDDAVYSTSPAALEVCDGADNDCDTEIDEDSAVDALTWYIDYDTDGYGSSYYTQLACEEPLGWTDNDEDCDDLDVVRFNPAFKLACGRVAETGDDLMSQPPLSRLADAPSWRQPGRMGLSMIDLFCASVRAVPECVVLDIDGTDDAVHGGPQLALFNAHYDEYIFQPIHIFEAITSKPVLPLLRPGKQPSGEEVVREAVSYTHLTLPTILLV